MTTDELNMLSELLADESDRMTAWEIEFIESLNQRRDRPLSEKQGAALDRVWQKLFP